MATATRKARREAGELERRWQQVSTREALQRAVDEGASHIEVVGELADQVRRSKTIAKVGKYGLAAIASSIALIPMTGGLSAPVGLTAAAAFTGLEVVAIIAAASVGLSLVLAVAKGYEEISYEDGRLRLKKSK